MTIEQIIEMFNKNAQAQADGIAVDWAKVAYAMAANLQALTARPPQDCEVYVDSL